jgi:hypothetical protein
MTPDRIGAWALGWVRFYSRDLPPLVTERRVGEIEADVHDHIESGRAAGVPDGRIAAAIASRMIRGVVADLAWRRHHIEITNDARTGRNVLGHRIYRSARRIAVAVLTILAIPFVATVSSSDFNWDVVDFVLAGCLLAVVGVALELAARRRGNLLVAATIAIAGVVAVVAGNADDAPGLVLLGILLVGSAAAVRLRRLPVSR